MKVGKMSPKVTKHFDPKKYGGDYQKVLMQQIQN